MIKFMALMVSSFLKLSIFSLNTLNPNTIAKPNEFEKFARDCDQLVSVRSPTFSIPEITSSICDPQSL